MQCKLDLSLERPNYFLCYFLLLLGRARLYTVIVLEKKLHAFVTVFCQWIRFNLNEDFYAAIVSITSSCKYNFSKILHTFS